MIGFCTIGIIKYTLFLVVLLSVTHLVPTHDTVREGALFLKFCAPMSCI